MAVTQQRPDSLRGSDGQVFDLSEATVVKRKSRIPELALGVLLIAGCALAALAWQTIADPSQTVLSAGRDVSRGRLIAFDDLQTVEVSSNDTLNLVDGSRSDLIIGRIAQVDLTVGTLIAPEMVADVATIEAGQALVGLAVPYGQLPTSTLAVGTRVDVVATAAQANDESFRATADAVIVGDATVAELASAGDVVLLSLAVSEDDAVVLARAAAADRIRLIAVPDDRRPPAAGDDIDGAGAGADGEVDGGGDR